MRYILLKSDDFTMFHQEIDCFEYEFYYYHKEAFRRMYCEQGKDFWVRYMLSFRSAQGYDVIRSLKGNIKCLSDYIDTFYINVHEEFIDGPFSRAKQFFEDIVKVVEDKGYISLLQSASVAKNPFHRKDTKDIYKRLFGNPSEITSYSKVYITLPLYRRLAGSLCVCLRRWLDAPEVTDPADQSYWVPPTPETADRVKELVQMDGAKLLEMKKCTDDILKVKITEDGIAVDSVICKKHHASKEKLKKVAIDDDNHPCFASRNGKLAVGGALLGSELLQRLSTVFQLSNKYREQNGALPDPKEIGAICSKKLEKCNHYLQLNGCEDVPPPKATSTEQAITAASSSINGSADKDRSECHHGVIRCGSLESLGIQVKFRSSAAGKSKTKVKISETKPSMKQIENVLSGGIVETRSEETRELKKKALNKSKGKEDPSVETISKATDSEIRKKQGDKKKLKATEESDSKKELEATKESDAKKELKATEESDSKKELEATMESDSKKELEVTEESDSKKELEVTEESDSKKELKATEESDSKKEPAATKDVFNEKMGTEEEKEPSRPGSKNVRTCMNCGLQEPAPKVFKKCKRCKDEGCLDPPYYCGRNCQVLDWTSRHRKDHEKSCG